tara:strand:+ start:7234 stop:8097 length:864 start_codon:yes stop_codon:yes gene_type:complete
MYKSSKYNWYLPDNDKRCNELLDNCRFSLPGQQGTFQRNLAIACCEKFDAVFDIGGHVGMWARPFTEVFKKTIVFEPIENHFNCLIKNLEDVDDSKYILNNICLSDKVGTVLMESTNYNTGQSRVIENNIGENSLPIDYGGDKIERPTTTLDTYIWNGRSDYRFEAADLIKIDVEGYEYNVLKGCTYTLEQHKPILIIEIHDKGLIKGGSGQSVIEFLKEYNYHPIPHKESMACFDLIDKKSFEYTVWHKKQKDFIFCHIDMYDDVLNRYNQFFEREDLDSLGFYNI